MIIIEVTDRARRKPSRVIFNNGRLADSFEAHARTHGARTVRLSEEIARAYVGALRDRAASRSEWRAGASRPSAASKQNMPAKTGDSSRDVVLPVRIPRAMNLELERIAGLAGCAPEQIVRASLDAFIRAAKS
jgi:hypothetical protein